jgi:hypothetical protein
LISIRIKRIIKLPRRCGKAFTVNYLMPNRPNPGRSEFEVI